MKTTAEQPGALSTDELALCRKMGQARKEYLAAKQYMKAKQEGVISMAFTSAQILEALTVSMSPPTPVVWVRLPRNGIAWPLRCPVLAAPTSMAG